MTMLQKYLTMHATGQFIVKNMKKDLDGHHPFRVKRPGIDCNTVIAPTAAHCSRHASQGGGVRLRNEKSAEPRCLDKVRTHR